ncbi:MAG: hypothetical protein DRP82_04565 [Planctomycetota bacterium]|nr:MAG: hypothetical protein DRP82_04565 [Planctomycetota bacterium]
MVQADSGLRVDIRKVESEVKPHIRAALTLALVGFGMGLLAHVLIAAASGHHVVSHGKPAFAKITSVTQKRTLFYNTYQIEYRFRDDTGREVFGGCVTKRMPVTLGGDRVVVFYDRYGTSVIAGCEAPLPPPWIMPILVAPIILVLVVAGRERLKMVMAVLRRGERLRAEVVGMERVWWRMVWVEPPMRVRLRFKAGRGTRQMAVVTYLWRRIKGMKEVTLLRRGRAAVIYELYAEGGDAAP